MSKQRYKDADFRTIFHDAPDAYLIMSATDGKIQECNKAAERMDKTRLGMHIPYLGTSMYNSCLGMCLVYVRI